MASDRVRGSQEVDTQGWSNWAGRGKVDVVVKIVVKNAMASDKVTGTQEVDTQELVQLGQTWRSGRRSKDCSEECNGFRQSHWKPGGGHPELV